MLVAGKNGSPSLIGIGEQAGSRVRQSEQSLKEISKNKAKDDR
jgi:hypothetical protein